MSSFALLFGVLGRSLDSRCKETLASGNAPLLAATVACDSPGEVKGLKSSTEREPDSTGR